MTCGLPSDRGVVPSIEAFAPLPAVGLPLARSGGRALAQAPEHMLFVPVSFWNRYSVRPWESTRTVPRLPAFAVPTVAACPDVVWGGAAAAVAPPPPPPHAATPSATSGTAAALAMKVMDLLRVILAPSDWGSRASLAWNSRAIPLDQRSSSGGADSGGGQALHPSSWNRGHPGRSSERLFASVG